MYLVLIQGIIALSVFVLAFYYVLRRLWIMIPSKVVSRILLVIFCILSIVPFLTVRSVGYELPFPVASPIYNISPICFYSFIYLIFVFLIFDFLRIVNIAPVKKYMYNSWAGFVSLTVIVAMIITAGYFQYYNKKRIELSIDVGKTNTGQSSTTKIVAVSDLNLGYGIGYKELRQWVQLINEESPDIVFLVGDIIDHSTDILYVPNVASELGKINSKHGVYAIMGNNEYMFDRFFNRLQLSDFLKNSGIIVLKDSVVLIDDLFYVIGRKDWLNKQKATVEKLTALLDKSKPTVLLDHQAFDLEEIEKNNIDVQLSGQMNLGQSWPFSWIAGNMYEKAYGFLKKGNSHIYVTSGIGINGGKFRMGTRSEYVVIYLRIKDKII
jgi:predicted MPP superfamily phosphohydrolase